MKEHVGIVAPCNVPFLRDPSGVVVRARHQYRRSTSGTCMSSFYPSNLEWMRRYTSFWNFRDSSRPLLLLIDNRLWYYLWQASTFLESGWCLGWNQLFEYLVFMFHTFGCYWQYRQGDAFDNWLGVDLCLSGAMNSHIVYVYHYI